MTGPDLPALALKALPLVIKAIRKLSEPATQDKLVAAIKAYSQVPKLTRCQRDQFWLYVVEYATDDGRARVIAIRNPIEHADFFVFDREWERLSEDGSLRQAVSASGKIPTFAVRETRTFTSSRNTLRHRIKARGAHSTCPWAKRCTRASRSADWQPTSMDRCCARTGAPSHPRSLRRGRVRVEHRAGRQGLCQRHAVGRGVVLRPPRRSARRETADLNGIY